MEKTYAVKSGGYVFSRGSLLNGALENDIPYIDLIGTSENEDEQEDSGEENESV